jgi:hypothetical protein
MLYLSSHLVKPGRIEPDAVGLKLLLAPPFARLTHYFQCQFSIRNDAQVINRDVLRDILLPVGGAMHA